MKSNSEWFKNKYGEKGEEEYKKFCESRKQNRKKFMLLYGELEGSKKWDDYMHKKMKF